MCRITRLNIYKIKKGTQKAVDVFEECSYEQNIEIHDYDPKHEDYSRRNEVTTT